jgi:hypothetical protein
MQLSGDERQYVAFEAPGDDNLSGYRAISSKSVLGLLLGFAAPLALLSPLFWVVPLAGIAACALALREIHAEGRHVTGRNSALAGLALSLVFGVASISMFVSHRWWTQREAQAIAQLWFDLLLDGQPHKAYQFTEIPAARQPLDDALWEHYRTTTGARESLQRFVAEPLVRALLALDGTAQVRFWNTESQQRLKGPLIYPASELIRLEYAITFGQEPQKTTFFARVALHRTIDSQSGAVGWRIADFDGEQPPRT